MPTDEEEWLTESEGHEEEEEDNDCTDPDTSSKYRTVARIVNDALAEVIRAIQPGKHTGELCELGDNFVLKALAPLFNKARGEKKIPKGLSFPTCVSVNEVVCHNNPTDETTDQELQVGDVVRIDIGGFLDGYSAVAAHTVVVQAEPQPITGKLADVVLAAQNCIAVAVKSLRPGLKTADITEMWDKIATAYDVTICEGILSHQMRRFVLDHNSVIISKQTVEHKVDCDEFDHGQVWALDIVVTSGAGKLREGKNRPSVFRRQPDAQYLLKMKASKDTLKEVQRRFPVFPFSLRQMSDLRTARLGISECLNHDLVVPYPVLYEKAGEVVAHFKTTVLITKNEIAQITGLPLTQQFESDKKVEDEGVLAMLKRGMRFNNKDKKKVKAEAEAPAAQ